MPSALYKMIKQYCKRGHDVKKYGRNKVRFCNVCEKLRDQSPERKEQLRRRQKKTREQVREILDRLKDKPCMDCSGRFNPWQMDFDHRPGEIKLFEIHKFANISSITDYKLNWLYREIAKCDLICANCHRDRTHGRSYAA